MSEQKEKFYEKITIGGKCYEYMMTSNTEILKSELEKLGCRLPYYTDYRYNPFLLLDVRKKDDRTRCYVVTYH